MKSPSPLEQALIHLNQHKNQILKYAELLPTNDSQFAAFRRLLLDELGEKGMEGKLKKLLANA